MIHVSGMDTVICQNLSKSFGPLAVVQDVSLRVAQGHILALLGPSGCGKTTLLRLIAGFEQLENGRISIAGTVVADGRFHLPTEKRRVGMVFQDYAIFPHLTVGQNVAFGVGKSKEAQARTAEMLALVGLRGLENKMPHQLSGGQQQRVALARALAPQPAVLLLDEPFSNLDAALRMDVRHEVRDLLKQSQATAVFVTHDQEEALFMGDEVAVMKAGRLEQVGTPETIFHQPRTRFVAEFLGNTDFIPGQVAAGHVKTLLGEFPCNQTVPDGASVEVAVRADDVLITPHEAGNGRITSRQFIGIAYLYRIQLIDGTLVHSWQPHTTKWEEGTAVSASLSDAHPLPYFHNGEAVSL